MSINGGNKIMIKYVANWAMALYLTDNLNHAKINFKSYVTDRATVIFVFDKSDEKTVETLCKGLAKREELKK
jgi:hypothetical protein